MLKVSMTPKLCSPALSTFIYLFELLLKHSDYRELLPDSLLAAIGQGLALLPHSFVLLLE